MTKCLADFKAISGDGFTVFHGSNLDVLPFMADNSVDSIVTDPPYELGFMGKKWDSTGIAYSVELWQECLRVLKPGGHLLAFGGSRTWHRLAVAIEDAGFDVRDSIAWLYGSGFPKSMDVSKAIDKAAGAEREVVRTIKKNHFSGDNYSTHEGWSRPSHKNPDGSAKTTMDITAPATDDAKKWAGWGTALKPAFEPVVVARKPLIGTVAENVLVWGVGGLNIDGSRIGTQGGKGIVVDVLDEKQDKSGGWGTRNVVEDDTVRGRFPANLILDEYTAGLLDEQSGFSKSTGVINRWKSGAKPFGGGAGEEYESVQGVADSGGASRFFYVAKASKRDRNEGLDGLPLRKSDQRSDKAAGLWAEMEAPKQNFHPTVKPTDLMRYLIKLVTPAGGTVLDPFTGSGSTGKAALLDGYQFVGIELTEEYLPIIEGRLTWAANQTAQQQAAEQQEKEERLF